jgi:hypothetical protein
VNASNNQPLDNNLNNPMNQKDSQELERSGKIPEQAALEPETGEDTYSDPERLDRIAGWAQALSWIMLIFFIVKPVIEIYLLWDFSGSAGQNRSSFILNLFLSGNPSILSEFFLGAVFFVVLQALSEGIYLFMDIEENTRKQSVSSTR